MKQGVLVSRQPIYRPDMKVFGYELLFRNGNGESASFPDGSQATAQVVVNAFMDIGLKDIVGSDLAFINFERQLLVGNYCEALPKDRVVLEILESVTPDPAVLERLQQLRRKGYRIALDDYVFSEPLSPLLELADFVKLDLLANQWSTIERAVQTLSSYPVQLIAEKVETREQVERCKAAGFHFFQGYFFCRPQNIPSKQLPPNRLATLQLLGLLNKPDIKIQELETAISQDLSLSYKLLTYINSAMSGLSRRVGSIRHATVLVGVDHMRAWANLILLSGFGDVPKEVLVTGAMRARMCELLSVALKLPNPEQYFLVGLFSVLDAVLDRPMQQVLSLLCLTDDINEALLDRRGELGMVLRCVQQFEQGEWNDAQTNAYVLKPVLEQTFAETVAWSNGIIGLSRQGAKAGSPVNDARRRDAHSPVQNQRK